MGPSNGRQPDSEQIGDATQSSFINPFRLSDRADLASASFRKLVTAATALVAYLREHRCAARGRAISVVSFEIAFAEGSWFFVMLRRCSCAAKKAVCDAR